MLSSKECHILTVDGACINVSALARGLSCTKANMAEHHLPLRCLKYRGYKASKPTGSATPF